MAYDFLFKRGNEIGKKKKENEMEKKKTKKTHISFEDVEKPVNLKEKTIFFYFQKELNLQVFLHLERKNRSEKFFSVCFFSFFFFSIFFQKFLIEKGGEALHEFSHWLSAFRLECESAVHLSCDLTHTSKPRAPSGRCGARASSNHCKASMPREHS